MNLTSAEAFQDYTRDYADHLISTIYHGFRSADHNTSHEGVKGELVLSQLTVDNLARRYSSDFQPVQNAFAIIPRVLKVDAVKVDTSIIPKAFEGSYLAKFRKKGQNTYDLPFEGYILQSKLNKLAQEQEFGYWRGVPAVTPAATDLLIQTVKGLQSTIGEEVTATNLTPVATGALTDTNAYAKLEETYEALGSQYQEVQVDCFMNKKTMNKVVKAYRTAYGQVTRQFEGKPVFDLGDINFVVTAGVPDDCILFTPKENIHYGYDGAMDASLINFQNSHRAIDMWMDFFMGVNFGIVHSDIIAINDQW